MGSLHQGWRSGRHALAEGVRIAVVRLRFLLLLGTALLIVAAWPTLRNHWDRLTGPAAVESAISPDTEYWCPMCPGVVSDWPGKCPVCHMSLVRRQKGDMTPLPDGVVARVQLSPYRVQLAGIRTSMIDFRPLVREIVLSGLLQEASGTNDRTRLTLTSEVYETDIGLLSVGQSALVSCTAFPGRTFTAHVVRLAPQLSASSRNLAVTLEVDNPQQELRPGMYASSRVAVPLASLVEGRSWLLQTWRDRAAINLGASGSGLPGLLEAAVRAAALHQGRVLAVPESAVIDTGVRKIVFLEQSPGLFDAVEIHVGRRCGDFRMVLGGLEPGQRVVTAGAFLLDAETRLNPAAGTGYFGAAGHSAAPAPAPPPPSPPSGLSAEDRELVKKQQICPVTEQPLGSMGEPVRVVVEGRVVFVCCEGCIPALRKDPAKYLARLRR